MRSDDISNEAGKVSKLSGVVRKQVLRGKHVVPGSVLMKSGSRLVGPTYHAKCPGIQFERLLQMYGSVPLCRMIILAWFLLCQKTYFLQRIFRTVQTTLRRT